MNFIFYIALLLFILLFGSMDVNIDYDFWARIIVGKTFMQTGVLLHNDFYSFGSTHEFIDHEWGSGVIFYLVQNCFSDVGLFVFKSLIIFLTFFFIVKTIKLQNKDSKMCFLIFFFALHAISYNIFSTIRCQIFSFFFFAYFIYILEYVRIKREYRLLWTLPVLNILWLNLHGGFVVGLALIFLYASGEYFNKKPSKYYWITLGASCFTVLINPYGIKYINYIFGAFLLNRTHIPEWHSAFFGNSFENQLLKYKIFFFVAVFSYLIYLFKNILGKNFKNCVLKIDYTKYLVLFFTFAIALKSARCHPFFVYALLIYCYSEIEKFINKYKFQKPAKIIDIVLFFMIFISTLSHLYDYKFLNRVNENFYPVNSVEFIKINNLKGNVFTNFHTASYVIYKLYPNNHIYMDGRYEEVYDNSLIDNMAKFSLAEDYREFLNHYHFDILIIDKTYPKIIEELRKDKNLFLAYEEKQFCVFLPGNLINKKFIYPQKTQTDYNKEKFNTNIDWL